MTAIAIHLPSSYLTAKQTVRSWLFTTDHKRVALLFFASITFFFFIGGFAATLIRIHLVTPEGDLLQPDLSNRLFPMPGIVLGLAMLWAYMSVPGLKSLYGTPWLLMLGQIVTVIPIGVRVMSSALRQVNRELEEAAQVHGAAWWQMMIDWLPSLWGKL